MNPYYTEQLATLVKHDIDRIIRGRDQMAKAKMKFNSDTRRHAKPSTLAPGDSVLHQQPKHNKLTAPYNSAFYTLSTIKSLMVTATNSANTRNSSFFKRIDAEPYHTPQDPDEDDDEETVAVSTPRYLVRNNRQPLHTSTTIAKAPQKCGKTSNVFTETYSVSICTEDTIESI